MKVYAHDYDKARKMVGPGKLPCLQFMAGDKKVLLPTGQLVNEETFRDGGRARGNGKAIRRELIKARRAAREKRLETAAAV